MRGGTSPPADSDAAGPEAPTVGAVMVDRQIGHGPLTPASATGTLRPEPHAPHEKCRTCGVSAPIDGGSDELTEVRYLEILTIGPARGKG